MSDDFEDLLKRWLRDRAGNDRSALQALAGNVAAFPPRRQRRIGPLASLAASIAVLLGLLVLASPRLEGLGGDASPSAGESHGAVLPGGPEPYVNVHDARLGQCFGTPEDMEFVFEMAHATDYRSYLPRMGLSPELDVEDPAFVVVYRDGWHGPVSGGVPGAERQSPTPGLRFVCVLVSGGDPNLYSDVDIAGLTVAVAAGESHGSSASTHDPNLIPIWAVNLAGQLDCDGPVASLGGEYPESFGGPDALSHTSDAALGLFLGPSNPFASLPTAGFTRLHAEPRWASFGHLVVGRAKAIILVTDTMGGPGWHVVGLRACDASEFDPVVPLTFPVTIWTDTSGNRISTEKIRSNPGPGHCGWESAIWLKVADALYIRDPQGVMAEWTTTSFAMDAQLPRSAIDSGYRTGESSLWLDPDGDAYVVSGDRVERWPRSIDPLIACR